MTGRCGIVEIEVEIENVCILYAQFLGDEIDKEITPFEFAAYNTENRQHILLTAESHTIVYLTIEVDSQITDLEQGALYML